MIDVRLAEPADAPAVAALAREAHALHAAALPAVFQPPGPAVVTAADVETLLGRTGHLVLVAARTGSIAGYAHAEEQVEPATAYKRSSAVLHLHAMAVSATHRRHGVGRALLAALRTAARARGLGGVSLDVYAVNAVARELYTREGFVPLRERMVAPLDGGAP